MEKLKFALTDGKVMEIKKIEDNLIRFVLKINNDEIMCCIDLPADEICDYAFCEQE